MKLKTLAAAAAVGMALSSGADAVDFYDVDGTPANNTPVLVTPTSPAPISINTGLSASAWNITSASLTLYLADDERGDAQGEQALIGNYETTNLSLNGAGASNIIAYQWPVDVSGLVTHPDGYYVFNQNLFARGTGGSGNGIKDFNYYDAKLVLNTTPVPEASELLLMGAGLVAVGAFARKRRAGAQLA
jgi:hypothetical protein